ncbi:hypothetical protein [Bacteroides heparinolyticus]|uniref:hypothetical protein n=1 Tax=Prevotella heparinolytica TaxID=28113 RepID=UPI0035A0E3F5
MKAKIKKTGEIVEVINYSKHNHCIEYGGDNAFGEYETKSLDDVELILDEQVGIDWEQRRYEIAKEVMAAFIAGPSYQFCVNNNYYEASLARPWAVAEDAVDYAEALIEELKKDKQKPKNEDFRTNGNKANS